MAGCAARIALLRIIVGGNNQGLWQAASLCGVLPYVLVGLISGTSDLSTFVPFALFIAFFSFFISLSIFDFFFLPILCIPSDSGHHDHRFNSAWGGRTLVVVKTIIKVHADD